MDEQVVADPFLSRMADLDALVAQCEGKGVFTTGSVRDTSNRSDRDWPWWSIQIERTHEDGSEKRRAIPEIALNSPAPGIPSVFKAHWQARIWRETGADSFRQEGDVPLDWDIPSTDDLNATMSALLSEAESAIAEAVGNPPEPEC